VILVDDGSTDPTVSLSKELGLVTFLHKENMGYGRNQKTCYREALKRGADIVVEASRLTEPTPLLRTAWIARGACVIPYGTMSAVELSLTDIMDKIVVDDWGQCKGGILGSLRAHVETHRPSQRNLHRERGEIAAGLQPRRERDQETILC